MSRRVNCKLTSLDRRLFSQRHPNNRPVCKHNVYYLYKVNICPNVSLQMVQEWLNDGITTVFGKTGVIYGVCKAAVNNGLPLLKTSRHSNSVSNMSLSSRKPARTQLCAILDGVLLLQRPRSHCRYCCYCCRQCFCLYRASPRRGSQTHRQTAGSGRWLDFLLLPWLSQRVGRPASRAEIRDHKPDWSAGTRVADHIEVAKVRAVLK